MNNWQNSAINVNIQLWRIVISVAEKQPRERVRRDERGGQRK